MVPPNKVSFLKREDVEQIKYDINFKIYFNFRNRNVLFGIQDVHYFFLFLIEVINSFQSLSHVRLFVTP